MLVHVALFDAAPAVAEDHQLALFRPAEAQAAAQHVEVGLHGDAAHAALPLGFEDGRALGLHRLGHALVGVDAQHPFGVDGGVVQPPVELVGVAAEGMDKHVRAVFAGDVHGAVGAAGIHHHHARGKAAQRGKAVRQVFFFVLGQHDGGEVSHVLPPFWPHSPPKRAFPGQSRGRPCPRGNRSRRRRGAPCPTCPACARARSESGGRGRGGRGLWRRRGRGPRWRR